MASHSFLKTKRSPLALSEVKERYAENRVAVISIDHQYIFRKWLEVDDKAHWVPTMDKFSVKYIAEMENLRALNLPIVHVALSYEDHGAFKNDMNEDDRNEIRQHAALFFVDRDTMTVRDANYGFPSATDEIVNIDIRHEIQSGERLFIKKENSAFREKDGGKLHHLLQGEGFDTLIVTGQYANNCVLRTLEDMERLGDYDAVLPCDMLYPAGNHSDLRATTREIFDRMREFVPWAKTTTADQLHKSLS
jgi:nicotinamidase-related amidase